MTRSSTRRWLFILLAVVFMFRCIEEYRASLGVYRHIRTLSYEDYFLPGLIPCVKWVQGQRAIRQVYGQNYSADRYLYQRLSEMLYPVPFESFDGISMKAGDIVILPDGQTIDHANEQVFQSGRLQVLKVEK